jgi:multiple sugar transport system permease protein
MLMYEQGFRWWSIGLASAIAFVLFAMILAVSALEAVLERRRSV